MNQTSIGTKKHLRILNTITDLKNFEVSDFPLDIQRLLNWFVFFIIYPALSIGGISITFYIFFLILYLTKKYNGNIFRMESYMDFIPILLGFIFLLSYLLAEQGYEEISIFSDFKLLIQYFYWLLVLVYFSTWSHKINFFQLSKSLFYGLIAITLAQYLFFRVGFPRLSQNSYIFTIISCAPISFYYVYKRFSFPILILFSLMLFASALLSQSRSGSILVFLQVVMIISLINPVFKKTVFIGSFFLLPVIILMAFELSSVEGRQNIAQSIEEYNPRMAELIEDPEKVTFRDKSWLTRKMMINKGLEIYKKFPWLGVGLGRFDNYWVDIERINKWTNDTMIHYNQRSSHNSYIQLLSETGQIGLGLFVLLILIILFYGVKYLFIINISPSVFIVIGFIGMIIHLWAIASVTGTNTWFILGLGAALVKNKFDK